MIWIKLVYAPKVTKLALFSTYRDKENLFTPLFEKMHFACPEYSISECLPTGGYLVVLKVFFHTVFILF